MKYDKLIIWTLVLLTSAACQKEEHPISDVPEISLERISHDTIREYQDVLTLSIRYTDGDGDLGFVEPSKYAVFVRDLRLPEFDGFYIGPLAPIDEEIAIQGTLHIEFPNLFLFGNRASEKTSFEVKFVDRKGHESNLISTEPVVIIKP